jgi:hypothetical protein
MFFAFMDRKVKNQVMMTISYLDGLLITIETEKGQDICACFWEHYHNVLIFGNFCQHFRCPLLTLASTSANSSAKDSGNKPIKRRNNCKNDNKPSLNCCVDTD